MIQEGYLAEFITAKDLLAAANSVRQIGYTRLDAFTPYPIKGLEESLGLERSPLAWIVFPIAALGAGGGFLLQWFCNAISYPINVGGRPLNSWPASIPITFEAGVLTAGVFAFLVFLFLNRYPEPWNPIFAIHGFDRSTIDRFFLVIDRYDPIFEPRLTSKALLSTNPLRVVTLGDWETEKTL